MAVKTKQYPFLTLIRRVKETYILEMRMQCDVILHATQSLRKHNRNYQIMNAFACVSCQLQQYLPVLYS